MDLCSASPPPTHHRPQALPLRSSVSPALPKVFGRPHRVRSFPGLVPFVRYRTLTRNAYLHQSADVAPPCLVENVPSQRRQSATATFPPRYRRHHQVVPCSSQSSVLSGSLHALRATPCS